jgi:hypothetical protein
VIPLVSWLGVPAKLALKLAAAINGYQWNSKREQSVPFKPGMSGNPKGKPKGTVTKINADIREMIMAALNKAGGVDYLAAQAETNPVAFLSLVARVCPLMRPGDADGHTGPVLIITGVERELAPEPIIEGECMELPALPFKNGNGHHG